MINWQMVVLRLRRVKPLSRVAKEVGCQYQHLNRLASGDVKEPRYNTGLRLLAYYQEYVGDIECL